MSDSITAQVGTTAMGFWDTTLIVGVFSVLATAVLFYLGNRIQAKAKLDDALNNLLNIGIQYPKLEREAFIKSITDYESDDEAMRYHLYCIAWFNYLHQLYKYHCGKVDKIHADFNCSEVVNTHKTWWKNNYNEHFNSYKTEFITFIQSQIK